MKPLTSDDFKGTEVPATSYISLGLRTVVVVPGALVHGVEGHATGLHGSCPGGA